MELYNHNTKKKSILDYNQSYIIVLPDDYISMLFLRFTDKLKSGFSTEINFEVVTSVLQYTTHI